MEVDILFKINKFLGVINDMGNPEDISYLNNLGINQNREPFIEINNSNKLKEPREVREPE